MKRACTALLVLLLTGCGFAAGSGGPPCVILPDAMPEGWRPSPGVQKGMNPEPWSESEADEATYSIRMGVDEITDLYAQKPTAFKELWEDSVASLIEVTYSGANAPALETQARDGARRNLTLLIQPYLTRDPGSAKCDEFGQMVPLAIYAHNQYQENDARIGAMTELSNAAYRACGSLTAAMGIEYEPVLAGAKASNDEEVFDLVIWSLLFIEAQVVPGLEVTAEARDFPPALWRFLQTYPLAGASAYEDGARNETFIDTAYLATHIAYIPTGNHRYPIYGEDSPSLYQFHRENFYAVLQMGELDLVAEFVDSLRQYGCTPENDLQVRDGTRYLLNLFHAGGDRWMTYREPGETDKDVDNYDLVHKAWTGVLGVRERNIEPAEPGTYGGVVRSWLPHPPIGTGGFDR